MNGTENHTHNTRPCKSMKLRMVIGGWTDYYVRHSDNWVTFNVHGTRVNVFDDSEDMLTLQWNFVRLTVPVGDVIKAMNMVDKWLEV